MILDVPFDSAQGDANVDKNSIVPRGTFVFYLPKCTNKTEMSAGLIPEILLA